MRWLVIRAKETMESTATGRTGGVKVFTADRIFRNGQWEFVRQQPLKHVPFGKGGGIASYHSPDGFAIGYGGSGPTDLALAICALFNAKEYAIELRRQLIEPLDQDKDVAIPLQQIEGIIRHIAKGKVIV